MKHAPRPMLAASATVARALLALAALAAVAPAAALPPLAAARAPSPDVAALLEGVSEIASPGVPGRLCVYGEEAFPVVLAGAGGALRVPVVAAARLGAGRVVALGHEGFFGAAALATADTGALVRNAIRWAAGADGGAGAAGPRVGVAGSDELVAALAAEGMAVESAPVREMGRFDVFVVRPWGIAGDDVERAAAYLAGGGGLVMGGPAWGWQQLNPGASMADDIGANVLLAAAGLQWADGYTDRTSAAGFAVDAEPSSLAHAGRALDAVRAHLRGEATLDEGALDQASLTLTEAARCVRWDDAGFLPRLEALADEPGIRRWPSPEAPLRRVDVPGRVLTVLEDRRWRGLPPEAVRAHPAAATFPGAVPAEAPRVTRTVDVDPRVPRWQGTGLYAAPGEVITVTLPPDAAERGWRVRVGAHADRLWHLDAWRRVPDVTAEWPLAAGATRVATPFGGLVYIVLPAAGAAPDREPVPVEIAGAVEAPRYVAGETEDADWRQRLRHAPAPWAEVGSAKLVVAVPASSVRELDDPAALMATWDRALDLDAELAAWPTTERAYPERIVPDEQISAGYMHAGYPIMTHLDQRVNLVDRAHILGGNWGLFHELGHNHQVGEWTFDGTGEVTVNLFTLYVYEHLCGVPVAANERGSDAFLAEQMAKLDFAAPDFDRWRGDPFLALATYVQLQRAFGWDAYRRVFAAYRALPAAERPRTDAEERDQWLTRFSRAVGYDLGPFFTLWGIPTSEAARASLADLPVWLPAGFPPGRPTPTGLATAPAPPMETPTAAPSATATRPPATATSAPTATDGAPRPAGGRLFVPVAER